MLEQILAKAETRLENGMYEQNITELSALLDECIKNGDEWRTMLHPIFTKLVASYGNNGQLEEVNSTLKKQFGWAKKYGGSALDLGKLFHNYGQVCLMEKNFSKAVHAMKIALIFKKRSLPFDLKTTIITYRELAFAYYKFYNYPLAGKYFETALALTKKLPKQDAELESSIINKYTSLLLANGELETIKSLLEYSKGLPYPNKFQETDALLYGNLQMIDHVYLPTNNFQAVKEIIQSSRKILDLYPDFKPAYANLFTINEAIVAYEEKNYPDALRLFQSIIDPDREDLLYTELDFAIDNCLYMMYESALQTGNIPAAEKYLNAYKKIQEIDLTKNPFIKLQNELQDIYFRTRQKPDVENNNHTLLLLEKFHIDIHRPVVLKDLIQTPNLEEILTVVTNILMTNVKSAQNISTANNIIDLTKRRLEFRNLKQSIGLSGSITISSYSIEHQLIAQALDMCSYLFDKTNDAKYAKDALQLMERDKNNQLYLAVKRSSLTAGKDIPQHIIDLENEVSIQVRQFLAQNTASTSHNHDIIEIQQNYRRLIDGIIKDYPEYFIEKYKNDFFSGTNTFLNKALKDYSFLEYFTTDTTIFAIAGNAGGTLHFSSTKLENPNGFREVLRDFSIICANKPTADSKEDIEKFSALSETISNLIWKPSAKYLSKKLIIVPDNTLSSLPFDIILNKPAAKSDNWKTLHYIMKEYHLSLAPSLQFLHLKSPESHKTKKSFLGIAYSPPQPNELHISSLNFAQKEVTEIAKQTNGETLENERSTESNITKMAAEYHVLHLACHAKADSSNGNASFLVLSSDTGNIPKIVFANNFYSSRLNNDLVVLSACESALGQAYTGEGIVGLTRSFFYTGARSVLSTLWQVSDFQAGEILGEFYKNISDDKDKATSLAEAKQSYLKESGIKFSHPFYWASFVVSGDPQGISLQSDDNTLAILGVIIFVFFVGLIINRRLFKKFH